MLRLGLVAVAYGATVYTSLLLVPQGGAGAALVWPPVAIGLAALYFWGYELWPALLVSFFAVLLARGIPPPLAAGVALGNLLETLLAVYLLNRTGFSPMFNRLRDSLTIIVVAFAATLLGAAAITTTTFIFNGAYNPFNTPLFVALWVGHAVSLLCFAPFALRWLTRLRFTKTRKELVEGFLVFGGLAAISVAMYWGGQGSLGGIPLIYAAVLLYIWAALRTGPRGITLALAMSAAIAATGVVFGWGPISSSANMSAVLFSIQALLGILAIIFLLFTSITEERQEAVINLERYVDQLESAVEKIQTEDKAKADFIAILAHELRNPLSPILSGLELLKSGIGKQEDIARMMSAHVHTIARLLDDLLDITRITQKKFKLERTPTTLQTIIAHAREMVEPAVTERNHTLTVTMPQDELWLTADQVRLTQVFANLLGNAAKYTDPGGTISLVAERAGDVVVVRVADTGIGIAKERLPHVFDAFGTQDQGISRGGLRIGLSLARRMVELHQGTLKAESEGEGRGSTFTVVLPMPPVQMELGAAPAPRRARFSKQALQTETARGATTVLVCDDNQGAAQMLGKLLENNNHTVCLAYTGAEAIAQAAECNPRVALLDIGLPDMDGYALARRLRAEHPAMLLVALTGFGQDSDKQKAKDAGFAEHLVKPVSIVDVEHVLTELGIRNA